MKPELRKATVDLFFYWINERHRIYLHKDQRMPKPWTEDPILRDYKFTNVFRQLDKGTVWLTKNFIEPYKRDKPELLFFNCAWYRMFNWTGTGDAIGWRQFWDPDDIEIMLNCRLEHKEQVFTGAHIVRSDFGEPKVKSILRVCTKFWEDRHTLTKKIMEGRSLREAFLLLLQYHLVGPFMSYEIVTDLRHTPLLSGATDIMTWANAGPGAIRGLQRLNLPASNELQRVNAMLWLLTESPKYLQPHVPALEMRDVEHSLCEFDKYCRVKFGEGRPRNMYPGQ